ncbi:MAG TPA: glycosyltransferase [Telluria sp.]|nr:glycosyltransferase [Telluria sp.]
MRILIDMQGAQSESRFRGIGRYSLSIALAIARNAGPHEVWLALNGALPDSLADLGKAFSALLPARRIKVFGVPAPIAEHDLANGWRARAAEHVRAHFLAELQPDVVLVTSLFEGYVDDAVTAAVPGVRTVAILYDLIPLLDPAVYLPTSIHRQYYDRKLAALRQCDLLLSISDYSRREAMAALGLARERVVNISTAVDPAQFRPRHYSPEAVAGLRARLGITRAMLMYAPGGFDSRKNFDGLIEAFAALPARLRAGFQLVIVSRINRAERANLEKWIGQAALGASDVVLTGYVSEDDLVMLYNLADLFVFPSRHEGFGLPVLEAMACGAPVIGADTTSIPEVIGNPDALFDPYSVAAITARLVELLGDAGKRARLREHGLAQAARFSWDRSAQAALAALERLCAGAATETLDWAEQSRRSAARYAAMLGQVAGAWRAAPHADDHELKLLAEILARNLAQTERARRARALPPTLRWRIEGPFDSSYSLALLNRETALALSELGHDVALHSTEGPGDFAADATFLRANPRLAALHARVAALDHRAADVASRNLYPPRVHDMRARLNMLHHFAWEESAFPAEWVDSFNEHLQGMTCLSRHVRKVMVDQGVTVPLATSGCGVDHWERIEADAGYACPGRAFRFLHVSSCFPRKGADVLLRAYGRAFTAADDVTLVIKTFANPHNAVRAWLADTRRDNPDFPDVAIIEEDLGDAQLKGLMEQCHALVAPSRAEGFGLPLAEAMLSGLPVIATGWSGQRDFCTEQTAWLVDFTFAPAQTHFGLFGSVWAEPDEAHLADTMRAVHALPAGERRTKADHGRALLLARFRWRDVALRLVDAARAFSEAPETPPQRIGWISTWNTRCGIAAYSAHLIHNIPGDVTVFAAHAGLRTAADGPEVRRCWEAGEDDTLAELSAAIDAADVTTLVLQFNYGFFNLDTLAAFLLAQRDAGRVVVAMLHATTDPVHVPHKRLDILAPALRACRRVLVHAPADLNRLKRLGLLDNVALFPHGVVDWPEPAPRARGAAFVLASYGFFLPHKGLPQLVEALALLAGQGRDVRLSMVNAEYPIAESAALIAEVRASAAALGVAERVEMVTGFLDDRDSLARLGQADLVVFPYQDTAESSSAAVRYGLASGRPVAITPLAIFDDIGAAAFRLPGQGAADIAHGIARLIDDIDAGAAAVGHTRGEADRWRAAHRYSRLGNRLLNMLTALQREACDA